MNKAKKCPVCMSDKLKWVYYAPSAKDAPELWEDMVDDGYSPMILAKRIECADCGATVPSLVLVLDDAIDYWNSVNEQGNRAVLQRIREEPVREAEHD